MFREESSLQGLWFLVSKYSVLETVLFHSQFHKYSTEYATEPEVLSGKYMSVRCKHYYST